MKSSPTVLHTGFQHCQGLDCLPLLWRLDLMSQESHSYLRPFKLFVDLVTESNDVFPVFLPIRWVSGFIFGKGKRRCYSSSKQKQYKRSFFSLPREKPLTSVTNYKMKKESSHMLHLFTGEAISKLRHPNNHGESD